MNRSRHVSLLELLPGLAVGFGSAMILGMAVGFIRWQFGLLPILQGMFAGFVAGTATGYFVPAEAKWLNFGQRMLVSVSLVLTFLVGEFMGIGLGMPNFEPWQFIGQVVSGEHLDLVIGPSRGTVSPANTRPAGPIGWAIFNGLDLLFQLFLTLLGFGIKLGSKN